MNYFDTQTNLSFNVSSFSQKLYDLKPQPVIHGTYKYTCCGTPYKVIPEDIKNNWIVSSICPNCVKQVTFNGLEGKVSYSRNCDGSYTKDYTSYYLKLDPVSFTSYDELLNYINNDIYTICFDKYKENLYILNYIDTETLNTYYNTYKNNKYLSYKTKESFPLYSHNLFILATLSDFIKSKQEVKTTNCSVVEWSKQEEADLIDLIISSFTTSLDYRRGAIGSSGLEWLEEHNLLKEYMALKLVEMDNFMLQASKTIDVMLAAMRNAGTSLTI